MSDQSDQSDHPLRIYDVLEEEYELLHGAPMPLPKTENGDDGAAERRLKNVIRHFHQKQHTAICLSGGGIRSATFGLGVLQGLAHNSLLEKFNYVSTVSGGGYIGSWLSAWIHREEEGLKGVAEQLPGEDPPFVMKPEAEPITHLRTYSNYLTPKLGLMSADTWTLVAIVIRNLLLNWLVLIPLLIAALALPRVFVSLAQLTPASYVRVAALIVGIILCVQMIVYAAISRPTITRKNRDEKSFFKWCFVPMLLSATLLALYWSWFTNALNIDLERSLTFHLLDGRPRIFGFMAFGLGLHLAAWLVYTFLIIRSIKLVVLEFGGLFFNGIVGGVLLFLVAHFFPHPAWFGFARQEINELLMYATLAVPIYLLLVFLALSLFVGVASRWTEDEDREWWARYGAWILIAAVVWMLGSFLVLLGPPVTAYLAGVFWGRYVLPAGGLIGVITALLARSANLPAKGEKAKGWMGMLAQYALPLGAVVFAVALIVALSLATNYLIDGLAAVWNWLGILKAQPIHASGGESLFDSARRLSIPRTREILLLMFGAGGLGIVMAYVINTNKFSHHAMYRNRLIRAYLGASRLSVERQPNRFTGFDSDDNVNMCELRPETLHTKSFTEDGFDRFAERLHAKGDGPSKYIAEEILSEPTRKLLAQFGTKRGRDYSCKALESGLIRDINKALLQKPIVPGIQKDLNINQGKVHLTTAEVKLNRQALEAAFKEEIRPADLSSRRPLHLINMTLNLVGGDRLAWQQRKAESFTVSPLHCGSFQIPGPDDRTGPVYGSYRRTFKYGGEKYGGISLGTAMAISGAAASPNMGYYSSPVVGFLMTLFNVRMGWWLGNPGPAGQIRKKLLDRGLKHYYELAHPKSAVYPIIAEALGWTDDRNNYVYLSDGGHFENLGLYEMVLRRCRLIVVSDAAGDPDFQYNDLGNAVQKVRTDLGIPIEFGPMKIFPRRDKKPGAYCAIGTIRYSAIDKMEKDELGEEVKVHDGKIIYIKPAFYGDEPRDIYRYAMTHETFPQQSTGDQWFDESQFESYRKLGSHIVDTICKVGATDHPFGSGDEGLDEFFEQATRGAG